MATYDSLDKLKAAVNFDTTTKKFATDDAAFGHAAKHDFDAAFHGDRVGNLKTKVAAGATYEDGKIKVGGVSHDIEGAQEALKTAKQRLEDAKARGTTDPKILRDYEDRIRLKTRELTDTINKGGKHVGDVLTNSNNLISELEREREKMLREYETHVSKQEKLINATAGLDDAAKNKLVTQLYERADKDRAHLVEHYDEAIKQHQYKIDDLTRDMKNAGEDAGVDVSKFLKKSNPAVASAETKAVEGAAKGAKGFKLGANLETGGLLVGVGAMIDAALNLFKPTSPDDPAQDANSKFLRVGEAAGGAALTYAAVKGHLSQALSRV